MTNSTEAFAIRCKVYQSVRHVVAVSRCRCRVILQCRRCVVVAVVVVVVAMLVAVGCCCCWLSVRLLVCFGFVCMAVNGDSGSGRHADGEVVCE